uniref:Mobile element protein n=1 Tax=Vibrio tasmaniensis TaxID=212663 RepID=A0A0H3ZRI0_9VIBR|nr:Mobile element protein [Vibrio tasmaniensis]
MFKGCHFPSEVILETVRYYLAYKLSYREIGFICIKVRNAT